MGLFDDTSSGKRDEVRIGVSEKDDTDDSKLKGDVESDVGSTRSSGSGSDVSMEEIHEQNEKIIDLLESLLGEKVKNSNDIGDPDRISDRRNSEDKDDQGMRGGMDELL